MGLLPQARWNLRNTRDGQRRMERRKLTTVWERRTTVQRKCAARNKRRRHRRDRRPDRKLRVEAKDRSRAGEIVVGTFKFRTLAFNGKNGLDHSGVGHPEGMPRTRMRLNRSSRD